MSDVYSKSNLALTELIRVRARMTLIISIIIIILLTINMLLMSSLAHIGAKPLFPGTNITIVLMYSLFVIIAGAFISGFYVWWANNVLDPLAKKARQGLISEVSK